MDHNEVTKFFVAKYFFCMYKLYDNLPTTKLLLLNIDNHRIFYILVKSDFKKDLKKKAGLRSIKLYSSKSVSHWLFQFNNMKHDSSVI